jgi:hypothetical protein
MALLSIDRRARIIVWITGLTLFVTAFFLPAVREPPATGAAAWGPGLQSHVFAGWECAAVMTPIFTVRLLQIAVEPERAPQGTPIWPDLALMALSGWVNSFVLLYLLCCLFRKLRKFRSFLAGSIVVCLIATWILLARQHFALLVGHWLWVAGIAVMLAAPFVMRTGAASESQANA